MKKIAVLAGARPNFVKIAPLVRALKQRHLPYFVVNTGQHFSSSMAKARLQEFSVRPDYQLSPSRRTTLTQFADILIGLEKIFIQEQPALVVVVGDVNATLAGAIVAKKLGIKLAHIEAGLRSHNYKMPEEYNRILTDQLADFLFIASAPERKALQYENVAGQIFLVGNIMIDNLIAHLPASPAKQKNETFYFCTLHRAENVDDKKIFSGILDALEIISSDCKIYLSLHPRTKQTAQRFGLIKRLKKIFSLLPPLPYRTALDFQQRARLVLTDSGGVQEETSYFGTPCLTLRAETERPITLTHGTNTLAGVTKTSILRAYRQKKMTKIKTQIPFWDGKTALRIVAILERLK